MTATVEFTIDGTEVRARRGQTILEAADQAGIYIPRLCAHRKLQPFGSCRVCVVLVNGRPQPACIQPVAQGAVVENDTERLTSLRRQIVEMLFVEGNHYCMFCERSGSCELQALGYRLGMLNPRYPFFYPARPVDATHPDIMLEHNRCILCGRCVRASTELDGKHVFDFVGRGLHKIVAKNSRDGLGGTNAAADDEATSVCPVGALMRKRVGYAVPIGNRPYDHEPIGSEIEARRLEGTK
jgi:[NiFe] hydrogenase diaphorase moiety small subunit